MLNDWRYFAITNPFAQDAHDPPAIARERTSDGTVHQERYDGTWVRSDAISDIRNNRTDGKLTPLTDETAAHLLKRWQPHADHSGQYACLNRATPSPDEPEMLIRVEEDGGVSGHRLNSKGNWSRVNMWTVVADHELAEIDDATRDRLLGHLHDLEAPPRPDDVQYRYWAIVGDAKTSDPMTAGHLLRSWDDAAHEERFSPRDGRWHSSILLYEINFGHRFDDAAEITEEVALRLQEKLVGKVGLEPTT